MLRIQVLGSGMIPRGYGLAPHRQLFWADKMLIATILTDSHLTVKMQHPEDGRLIEVTRKNLDKLWNSYSDKYSTNSNNNKLTSEVVNKPETLIDKNKKTVYKEPLKVIVEEPKVESANEKKVIEDLKKNGVPVASDKQFEEVVEKTINSVKNETIKKPEPVLDPKVNLSVNNNGKKDDKKNEVKNDNKKDEKKIETILHPINNPENK